MTRLYPCWLALLLLFSDAGVQAQARFDLAGPRIEIRVTRAGVTLPIATVPNLQPGDQLWLHPAFPDTQSVHYLLIAAFLRGTTNPPPDSWFFRIETWKKDAREEGVTVTVPAEAQQAILFLAPETGGDFPTLRSAVKGRPGVFVRATQDLDEASFEQTRIEKYLDSMKRVPPGDQAALENHSNLLARTLNLKPNADCYKRPLDQQYNCLTQTGTQTLLDDGHAQSIVAALSSGQNSDFINAASYTSLAGGGTYSAYVGALVDLIRVMNSIHTAQYQYIPALALPEQESLNLRLNTAPSFHNPKSVIVIGLPPIIAASLPPLRPAEPDHVSCLLDTRMVLPIEGAPLVFSTGFAHGLVLHLNAPPAPGQPAELPLSPDAYQGGLMLASASPQRKELPLDQAAAPSKPKPGTPAASAPAGMTTGTVQGFWGFAPFTGPTLPLQQLPGGGWHIVSGPDTPANLIAGQPNHLQLASSGTACIRSIALEPGGSQAPIPLAWKLAPRPAPPAPAPPVAPVDLTLNLQQAATPGSIRLSIQQFGQPEPDHLGTRTFAEPAKIESVAFHAGDQTLTLTGNSLEQVQKVTLRDQGYLPVATPGSSDPRTRRFALAHDASASSAKPGDRLMAEVHLEDGRTLPATTTVLAPRPVVSVLSGRISAAVPTPIQLSGITDLPLGATLTLFLKSKLAFPRAQTIEIAQADPTVEPAATAQAPAGSAPAEPIAAETPLRTTLSIAAGTLVLEDAHTVLATFDPLKTFGSSTFGPFRLRALAPDGTPGDWLPLATIVRLPTLTDLRCPTNTGFSCQLAGSALYLIDSVATDAAFTAPTRVPEGFVEPVLAIPHPAGQTFYLKLRDDPATVYPVTMAPQPESTTPHSAAHTQARLLTCRSKAPCPSAS